MTAAVVDVPDAADMSGPQMPAWEHRSELTLAALPSAVTAARLLVRHTFADLQLLVVRLQMVPQRAVVEVWDRSDSPPHPRLGEAPALEAAEVWGHDLPQPGKRVVWCAVPAVAALPESALPRRIRWPRADEVTPIEPVHELAFLERVRDGIRRLGREQGDH